MLFLDHWISEMGQINVVFRSRIYQFWTTIYQKQVKSISVSDHGISESGQKNTVFRSAKYQKQVNKMLFSGHTNINFRSET